VRELWSIGNLLLREDGKSIPTTSQMAEYFQNKISERRNSIPVDVRCIQQVANFHSDAAAYTYLR
jgi:hypothetical protein